MSDGCRGQMGAIVAWVGWIGMQKVNITGGNTPNVHGIILAICDVICSEVERRILGLPNLVHTCTALTHYMTRNILRCEVLTVFNSIWCTKLCGSNCKERPIKNIVVNSS